MENKKQKLKKKKATKKEIEELREIVIEIQRNPEAMHQIRRFVAQTA